MADGVLLGLHCHGLQFVEQDLGVKLARDLGTKLVEGRGNHLVLGLPEQLPQGPGPVESFGVDLDLLAVIGHNDVVHGPDVTAWIEPDCSA